MPPAKSEPNWMTWGECIALCRDANVSRKTFIKLAQARDKDGELLLKRRVFPDCTRARYWRASLRELLQLENP